MNNQDIVNTVAMQISKEGFMDAGVENICMPTLLELFEAS